MKKPELMPSVLAVALLTVCFGYAGSALAQNGGPTDASATVTLLEGIDSARSQPGHQYRAVLDKPISVSGFPIPKGTPAIVVLTQARAGSAAIWTLQLTGFVVGGAPVAVTGTSPTLPRSFGNLLGAVNSAGRATAAGLRVFLQPEQVVTFALGAGMGGGPMATQGSSPMVQEQSGIQLELTGCTKEGTRVDCEFFATNVTANDFNLGFCDGNGGNFHGSYLIDQLGNKLLNPAWTLGSMNGNSGNRQLMLPGVRTPLSLVFQPLDARAVSLLRLDLAYSNVPHQSCQNDFLFSGIPLPDHVVSAAPPAPGTDSDYNAATPATANPSSSMQVRGQVGYSLQGCAHEGINIVCTIGATALVANPRHVTWDNVNSYIVDTSGNKLMISQMYFGADPTANAVLMQNQAIPLTLTFASSASITNLSRLELVGNDGTPFNVRWTNVPVLPEQVQRTQSNGATSVRPAQNGSAGDPATFELVSVKLRMNGKDAIAALENKYGVHAKLTHYTVNNPEPQGLTYSFEKTQYRDTPGEYVGAIQYRDKSSGITVKVSLMENYPYTRAQPELVTNVLYQFHTVTGPDREAFEHEAIKHYTDLYGEAYVMPSLWCTPTEDAPSRRHGPPVYCDPYRARFSISGDSVDLSDNSIGLAITNLWNQRRVVKTKPVF